MSKLIVEMKMPTVCDECPMMYDGIVCAATGTEVYPNRQARILKNGRDFNPCENRLDDCPIIGVLPEKLTVEAVHVVRCRECKWFAEFCDDYKQKSRKDGMCEHPTLDRYSFDTTFDFYCAEGERDGGSFEEDPRSGAGDE